MPYRQSITAAYNAGVEDEYKRLTETPLREIEYRLITELLDEYISNKSTVIDIGAGPGRYAEYLLLRNCKLGVVDLSAKSLKAFSDRMEGTSCLQNILFNRVSCATQLNWIEDSTADAILLMGPLYHLIDETHRNNALANCHRILKPGGYLFSVFLSPFSGLEAADLPASHKKHTVTHTIFKGYKVAQFRCWPCEAKEIMSKNMFETIRIRNIEGEGTFISEEKLNKYNSTAKKNMLLNQLRASSEDENKLGITQQFIVVSKKQ